METKLLTLADVTKLRACLISDTPILVLIDPMLGEPLPSNAADGTDMQAAREAMWQRPVQPIPLSERTPLPPQQHPYLVELEGMTDPLLEATLEIAHDERLQAQTDGLDGEGAAAHRIGGWLQSTMHLTELAEQLSTMLQVNTEAPTKATYLRLVDRRVLALLRYVVGDALVAQQFGRIQNWAYLNVHGQISALKTMSESPSPIRLDRTQWTQMEVGEMVNRTLALWLGEASRRQRVEVCNIPAQALYDSLFVAIARAAEAAQTWPHRFQQLLDRSVWSALLLLDPAVEHSASIHQLLNNTGAQDDPNEPAEPLRFLHHQITAYLDETKRPRYSSAQLATRHGDTYR